MSISEHHERILTDPEYKERWFGVLARTIAVDFDGVIHPYTKGWIGPEPDDEEPMPGVEAFLSELVNKGFKIIVFSTRCADEDGLNGTGAWLEKHGLNKYIYTITCQKPPAIAYVDDRAIQYRDGNWEHIRSEIARLAGGDHYGAGK